MTEIPSPKGFDKTVSFLAAPYRFIAETSRRLGSDVFRTRLALQRMLCMVGRPAAGLFYDDERFKRDGALPGAVQQTLTGQGSIQSLDGEAHRHRKQMFMTLLDDANVTGLAAITADLWPQYARKWESMPRVVLYDEVRELLCRAVCAWAGVPLPEADVHQRTDQLTALFADAASLSIKHIGARIARRRAERWMIGIVERLRMEAGAAPRSIAEAVALHRDEKGDLLSPHIAAVELLNLLRPTVAVAVFIVYAAHALHANPAERNKLADATYAHLFANEVRRFYPLFPTAAARVRRDFEWQGMRFREGTRALLDLYATNHDPRIWDAPDQFRPERFREHGPDPFGFIPQGGGDAHVTHRCPGEGVTVALTAQAARFLATSITYAVPPQDLTLPMSRIPPLPPDGFAITDIRSSR